MMIHPRDPYTRIDILPTDRKIRVDIDGKTVADCQAGAMSLWETNLPVRWYLPKTAVSHRTLSNKTFAAASVNIYQLNWQYINESTSQTGCPYKGWARYSIRFNVRPHL